VVYNVAYGTEIKYLNKIFICEAVAYNIQRPLGSRCDSKTVTFIV
jgi:hypothetical protein